MLAGPPRPAGAVKAALTPLIKRVTASNVPCAVVEAG
jgi:hypothetical protein